MGRSESGSLDLQERSHGCWPSPWLDLPRAGPHCSSAERRAPEVIVARGAAALKRTIFGLLAFFLLVPLARAGGGPAQLNLYDTPAEARWAPFVADMPACEDNGVLSTISGRFAGTQREFWNSNLAIAGFDRVREIGFRSNGLSYIPRRYCVARAAMSDQKERTVVYSVGTQLGIIGNTWGVEWCVVGIDPTFAYAPACEVIRPILEREIGKAKWLSGYGLRAGY
jgi:hypothetical protein